MVAVFILAASSDYLDGYLARKLQISTKFGAFLDPVADKLIVATALIILLDYYHNFVILLPTLVILLREILVSALREWLSIVSKGKSVAVSFIAKIKTSSQLVAICFLLDNKDLLSISSYKFGVVLLYVATLLTLWSGMVYLYRGLDIFSRHKH